MGKRRLRRRPELPRKYETEADLCDEFSYWARQAGFVVHAETGGFDLVMVASPRCGALGQGTQIGVQAKLRANLAVLHQALPRADVARQAPHYYAVLVPFADRDFIEIAGRLHIGVFCATRMHSAGPERAFANWSAHQHGPRAPLWVPAVEIAAHGGGAKSPVTLTEWKEGALKLCALALQRGYLTRHDFAERRISIGRWVRERWIRPTGETELVLGHRVKRYALTESLRAPHRRYPKIFAALTQEAPQCVV